MAAPRGSYASVQTAFPGISRERAARDRAGSVSQPPNLSGPRVPAPRAPCQGDSCVSPMINEEPAELTRSVLLGPL